MTMRRNAVALGCGVVFALGLGLSGMTRPSKVRQFLDFTRDWDPSLAFVMGGALAVALPLFAWTGRRSRPAFDERFHLSPKRTIDAPLVLGSALFGIGWGIAGLCPGPAIVSIASGAPGPILFTAAMLGAMALRTYTRQRSSDLAAPSPSFSEESGSASVRCKR
jgi:uncharacterized membrane protein YedE/YeeE